MSGFSSHRRLARSGTIVSLVRLKLLGQLEETMSKGIKKLIAAVSLAMAIALVSPVSAQQDTKRGAPTAKGQYKESGKEVGRAGASLGHNVRHGRVARGGKHFGKHMGHAGKSFGRGTKRVVKRAVTP
jgi:hypothetical protein